MLARTGENIHKTAIATELVKTRLARIAAHIHSSTSTR